MAAAPEDAQAEEVPPEFECPICMKLLLEPVTVSCGHTFCRKCLEQSLGYRGLCGVCRAPVAAGQGVNVLLRSIIADRYPHALAQRHEEIREELLAGEREATEARHREARGAAAREAGGGAGVLLPLLQLPGGQLPSLPHCNAEVALFLAAEQQLVEYALQGPRRLGIVHGSDDEYALGVCFEILNVERPPQQQQQPRHRPLVTVWLTGKFRFWLVEPPELHANGFKLGRCEAFFDEPLPPADLAPPIQAADGGEPLDGPPPAFETAGAARAALEQQLTQVGHEGRRLFIMKFGNPPVGAAGAETSTSLERLSFWLLGVLALGAQERTQWLSCVDTRARLEHCRARLEAGGGRAMLNLPGTGSWMHPSQSALSSFVLLLAIVAVLVAKAMGLLERRRLHEPGDPMQDAWVFGQLLR